jgi:hypothetical protein
MTRDVRNCQIKTMPHVEKKDLLELDHRTVILSGSQSSGLGEMSSGLYRRGQTMGGGKRSLVSDYLQSPDETG